MMHSLRTWKIFDVSTPEELARQLTQYTLAGCTGFRLEGSGMLFLNDSTSGDGAQEYGVVLESSGLQVESVTFGWMSEPRALELLRRYVKEPPNEPYGTVDPSRWAPDAHPKACYHCA